MNTEVINTASAVAPKNDTMVLLIYCGIVVLIIYFFMVLPNKKRMNEYKSMLDSLKVGNRVMAAGIFGKIKKINEKTIDLEIAKGVVIEVSKNAVAGIDK